MAQLQAAARFAAHHGRNWKQKLRSLWLDGAPRRYGVVGDDAALLQQLRNQRGPLWLCKVRTADLFKIAGVRVPTVFVASSGEKPGALRAEHIGHCSKRTACSDALPIADGHHSAAFRPAII